MNVAEQRRAHACQALGNQLVAWLSDAIVAAGLAEEDVDSVVVGTLVGTASAFAAARCADAAANVALIHCIAESAAADIYGPLA